MRHHGADAQPRFSPHRFASANSSFRSKGIGGVSCLPTNSGASQRNSAGKSLDTSVKLDWAPVGDFSLYDHVLDTSVLLGNVPERTARAYLGATHWIPIFRVARGRAAGETGAGVAAGGNRPSGSTIPNYPLHRARIPSGHVALRFLVREGLLEQVRPGPRARNARQTGAHPDP